MVAPPCALPCNARHSILTWLVASAWALVAWAVDAWALVAWASVASAGVAWASVAYTFPRAPVLL